MGAHQDGPETLFVALLNNTLQADGHTVVQLGYRLTPPRRGQYGGVLLVEKRKQLFQLLGRRRGRVFERGRPKPVRESCLTADLEGGPR